MSKAEMKIKNEVRSKDKLKGYLLRPIYIILLTVLSLLIFEILFKSLYSTEKNNYLEKTLL